MVEKVTGGKTLPAEVVQQIVSKTDGVPLFVEELTKTVLESSESIEVCWVYWVWRKTRPVIPTVGHSRHVAGCADGPTGSVGTSQRDRPTGCHDRTRICLRVTPGGLPTQRGNLHKGLRQLVEAELVYQSGRPPQARIFSSMLYSGYGLSVVIEEPPPAVTSASRTGTRGAVSTDCRDSAGVSRASLHRGGTIEQAIPYWQRAGQRAIERSANVEAIAHLTKGLELLKTLPDTPERAQQELTLQIALGDAVDGHQGLCGSGSGKSLHPGARAMPAGRGNSSALSRAVGLRVFYFVRAE